MRLTKENTLRQRAIRKALSHGKSVSGLLAGLIALVTSGCRPHTPANTMGSYPNPSSSTNACSETDGRIPMGDLSETPPKTPPKPQPKRPPRRTSGLFRPVMGKFPSPEAEMQAQEHADRAAQEEAKKSAKKDGE